VNGTITPDTTVTVSYGDTVQYTFTPNAGYHIDSLLIDGIAMTDSASSYTFIGVTSSHTIVAHNSLNQYSINPSAVNGSTLPSVATMYNHGDTAIVTLVPQANHHLDSLLVDGVIVQDSLTRYTFTGITSSHFITAYFGPDTIAHNALVHGSGTITPAGTSYVPYNDSLQYVITPSVGFHIDSVVINGTMNIGPAASYTFYNVTTPGSIDAYFSLDVFTLSSTAVNGTITPNGPLNVLYGDIITYTFAAMNAAYQLDSLIVDSVAIIDSTSSYTFEHVAAPHSISAYYSIKTYSITVNAVGNGTITPGNVIVN
jgi:hypothetical protein